MARSSQTQQKRQRENKLREKAQLKRDRRQQGQAEKKLAQVQELTPLYEPPVSAEIETPGGNEPPLEGASTDTTIAQTDPYRDPTDWASTKANSERTPPIGGIMASKL